MHTKKALSLYKERGVKIIRRRGNSKPPPPTARANNNKATKVYYR